MKLIILKNNLLEGLFVLERSSSDNPNLPILKNILVKAENNQISFSATNLEMAVTSIVSGKILENGETTIPFSVINSVVKNLGAERVSLDLKGDKFVISTDNYEAIIQSQSPKDFPIIPDVKNKNNFFEIEVPLFKEALQSVVIATQFSEIRPEISGVFFDLNNQEGLTLVATDSFRLAKQTISSKNIKTEIEDAEVIVPLKTALEALRIFKSEEGKIKVYIEQTQIVFETFGTKLTSHLIDGKFPEYEAVIPKQTTTEISVEREEFLNAIKLTSSFSGRINDITIKVADNKKLIELTSSSSNIGENKYKVPAKIKGEKPSIVFNWRYLLDGIKIYGKTQEITIGIVSGDKPAVLKSSSEPTLVYVVMPLKT